MFFRARFEILLRLIASSVHQLSSALLRSSIFDDTSIELFYIILHWIGFPQMFVKHFYFSPQNYRQLCTSAKKFAHSIGTLVSARNPSGEGNIKEGKHIILKDKDGRKDPTRRGLSPSELLLILLLLLPRPLPPPSKDSEGIIIIATTTSIESL